MIPVSPINIPLNITRSKLPNETFRTTTILDDAEERDVGAHLFRDETGGETNGFIRVRIHRICAMEYFPLMYDNVW